MLKNIRSGNDALAVSEHLQAQDKLGRKADTVLGPSFSAEKFSQHKRHAHQDQKDSIELEEIVPHQEKSSGWRFPRSSVALSLLSNCPDNYQAQNAKETRIRQTGHRRKPPSGG